MAYEAIKKDIQDAVSERLKDEPRLPKALVKVNEEMERLSKTTGLESKNNLEAFYSIWKANNGKVGHKNDINSWTAYYLGMTESRPDGDFLPTRRAFARAGFPDIDTDFDYENRDDVYGIGITSSYET